jgi:hypothetical protein
MTSLKIFRNEPAPGCTVSGGSRELFEVMHRCCEHFGLTDGPPVLTGARVPLINDRPIEAA